MSEVPFYKTLDTERTFKTFDPAQRGTCRIRLFQPVRALPVPRAVIVASQSPHSAASITNFAEELATDVIGSYWDERGGRLPLSSYAPSKDARQGVVWIEHYPPGTMLVPSQERFCIVTFLTLPDGTFGNPCWHPVDRTFVEHSLLRLEL